MSLNKTYAKKKAALANAAWMNQSPHPIPLFLQGQHVMIYRGAGWAKATVIRSHKKGCTVKLTQEQRNITVYDARCIKPA